VAAVYWRKQRRKVGKEQNEEAKEEEIDERKGRRLELTARPAWRH
jgi:hypothetical protein